MFYCCKIYISLEMDELSIGQVLAFLIANDMNLTTLSKIYLTIPVSRNPAESFLNLSP